MRYNPEGARKKITADLGPNVFENLENVDVGKYSIVCGDQKRVNYIASMWDNAEIYDGIRGFRGAVGTYKGSKVTAFSVGIGGPSAEIALTGLARLGVEVFVRVGTTGSMFKEIGCGQTIINEASVRMDGTSQYLVRDEFPATASYDVTAALIQAAENLDAPYHVGIGMSAASFYAGEGRPSYGGYTPPMAEGLIDELRRARVLNMEQEAATIFTMARLFGFRSGAVCAVVANRITNEWKDNGGVERACRIGTEALHLISTWDQRKAELGKKHFYPSLIT